MNEFDVQWFAWRDVEAAFSHARAGGVALHHFHWDLRKFGLGSGDPSCHVIAADPDLLRAFAHHFDVSRVRLSPPRRHRPDIWHFDAFGWVLDLLKGMYPPPAGIEDLH